MSDIAHHAANTIVTKTATIAQYGGSGAALYFGLTANEIAAFGGLFIAVVGFFINWWYKHQHLQLAKLRIEEELDNE